MSLKIPQPLSNSNVQESILKDGGYLQQIIDSTRGPNYYKRAGALIEGIVGSNTLNTPKDIQLLASSGLVPLNTMFELINTLENEFSISLEQEATDILEVLNPEKAKEFIDQFNIGILEDINNLTEAATFIKENTPFPEDNEERERIKKELMKLLVLLKEITKWMIAQILLICPEQYQLDIIDKLSALLYSHYIKFQVVKDKSFLQETNLSENDSSDRPDFTSAGETYLSFVGETGAINQLLLPAIIHNRIGISSEEVDNIFKILREELKQGSDKFFLSETASIFRLAQDMPHDGEIDLKEEMNTAIYATMIANQMTSLEARNYIAANKAKVIEYMETLWVKKINEYIITSNDFAKKFQNESVQMPIVTLLNAMFIIISRLSGKEIATKGVLNEG